MAFLRSFGRRSDVLVYDPHKLSSPQVFLLTTGDVSVLPKLLDAAERYTERPSDEQMAELVLDMTGSKLALQYEPGGMTFVKNRVGSTAKAEAELGFRARVTPREGLRELIEWRKQHKELVARKRRSA